MHIHSITVDATAAITETTQCLCLASRRAARTITREFDRALRGQGLRATQFTLLAALHLAGPRSIGDLAELLSADRTTLTRNLAVAEQHGWATTRTDPGDARSRIAAITAKGLRQLTAALPAWRGTQQRLLEDIGPQAAESLHRLAGGPCAPRASIANQTGNAQR
jgi:DNA-binding MarR family transcriptional regulator